MKPQAYLSLLRDAAWFGRDRASDYARFVFLIYLPGLVFYYLADIDVIRWPGRTTGIDFTSFWTAARLALNRGAAAAYDSAALLRAQGLGDHFFAFLYPPPFLAVALPFGLLAFRWAFALWIALGFAAYFLPARRLLPDSAWVVAAFPPAFVNAGFGQNGGLSGGLYAGIALLLKRRPFVAGLLVGGLVCKPQLAVLILVAFLAGRQWRAIAGAALSTLAILLACLAAFGPETYQAFLANAPLGWLTLNYAPLWPKMVGLYPCLRMLGVGPAPAIAAQLVLFAACAVVVWRTWSRAGDLMAKMAVLVVCGLLATPYAFVYDLPMLIVPVCWLIRVGMKTGFLPWEKVGLAVVYTLAFFAIPLATGTGFNGSWLILAALLAMLLRRHAPLTDSG